MVQVKLLKKKKQLNKITISGHAGDVPAGENLVCAGVSTVVIGLLNAIDIMAAGSCKIVTNDDNTEIEIINSTDKLETILKTGIIQLETIEEIYPKFIKITEVSK